MRSLEKIRRMLLFAALALAVTLFAVDRYATYVHRPAADSKRVAIYTTQWCPYCKRLRADLAASGVEYAEYDVEKTLQGALGFWALRGRGVPVSAIGAKVVYGYRVDQIESALRVLGYAYQPALPNPLPRASKGASPISIPNAR